MNEIKCLPGTCKALGLMLSTTHRRRKSRKKSKSRNSKGQRRRRGKKGREREEVQEEEEGRRSNRSRFSSWPLTKPSTAEAPQHFCTEIHI